MRRLLLMMVWLVADFAAADQRPFVISVVDEQTGRGVPLVELRTVNHVRYFTDSGGNVAVREAGLMDHKVFFHVAGHGHEFPADGFGYRGKSLHVTPGGAARLQVRRINVAQRLYRVTGEGIYRDTVLAGKKPPIEQPLLGGQVFGSDSVVCAVYRGKIHWFWGDTNRPSYPLGNFHVPGATSRLPEQGGLDPAVGIDLHYLVGPDGFAKPTARMPGDGPTWIDALVVVPDENGRQRLMAAYVKVRRGLKVYQRGLVRFNDEQQVFEKIKQFPLDAPIVPTGHPFTHGDGKTTYVYFADPYPLVRAPATVAAVGDLSRYEAFTCLRPGTTVADGRLDRDASGALRYAWKKNTPPVKPADQEKLIRGGRLKREESLLLLRDVDTGKAVSAHRGTVSWNAHRRRWVMIAVEVSGTSLLGEVWYSEAPAPWGPWVYARKIVTHDKYSFYNPKHHPFFDKHGGREIFFEGTYATTFSGNTDPTPRYDYNQIMYKLDLADPRVAIPGPVYRVRSEDRGETLVTGSEPPRAPKEASIAFFAPVVRATGTVPVVSAGGDEAGRLELKDEAKSKRPPRFFAWPADAKHPPAATVALYGYRHDKTSAWVYSTDAHWTAAGYTRAQRPLCRVWSNPVSPHVLRDLLRAGT